MNGKRLSINLVSNLIQFATSLIISFFFTPYFVSKVGEVGYSFYSMACTCISYFTVITTAVTSMASRYITIAYHKGDKETVKKYYSSVFYSVFGISILFSVIVVLCVLHIDSLLEVPPELLKSVQILFLLVLFSGLFTTVCSVFSSTVFCLDRLDLKAVALIFVSVVRVVVLFVLFYLFKADIVYLGISYSASVVFEALFYVLSTKKLMPEIKIKPKFFRKKLVKELIGVGVWNSVNQVNTILIVGLDVLMANVLVSPVLAGALSISKTIPNQLISFIIVVANVFLPSLTIAYAHTDKNKMTDVFKTSFDLLGFGSAIVIAGFFACGKTFFALWMPTVETNVLYWTAVLGILPMVSNASTQCMGNSALLAAKMKLPVLVTLGRGILGIVIVYILTKTTSYGVYAIAGVSSVLTVIYEFAFSVPHSSYCIGVKKWFFYKNKLKFVLNVAMLTVLFSIIVKIVTPEDWLGLIIVVGICAIFGVICNFFFYFNKDSRKQIINKVKQVIKNKN